MKYLVENFNSPEWWVGVVLFGIVLSTIGAYFKDWINSFLGFLFKAWRVRQEIKTLEREERIKTLVGNHHRQIMVGFNEMRFRFRSTLYLIMALFSFNIVLAIGQTKNTGFFGALSLLCFFLGMSQHFGAMRLRIIISEALSRETEKKISRIRVK